MAPQGAIFLIPIRCKTEIHKALVFWQRRDGFSIVVDELHFQRVEIGFNLLARRRPNRDRAGNGKHGQGIATMARSQRTFGDRHRRDRCARCAIFAAGLGRVFARDALSQSELVARRVKRQLNSPTASNCRCRPIGTARLESARRTPAR